jgi:two-component system KDP operon response regulator KdpE
MTSLRVLVVDDEPQIVRFLRPALEASGYEVLHAGAGREALRLIANSAPDIIVLDLGLPDMDGKEVLVEARKFTSAPILVLSARDREAEKIAALDLGADDYVEKPFAIGELLARLRTALRHRGGGEAQPTNIEVEGLFIDMDKRRVTKNGKLLKLTPKDLLCVLARHAGRVVTHGQILISGREAVAEHGSPAPRFLLGRFVLQHVPVLAEDAIGDPQDIDGDPIARASRSGEAAVNHGEFFVGKDQSWFVSQPRGRASNQVE